MLPLPKGKNWKIVFGWPRGPMGSSFFFLIYSHFKYDWNSISSYLKLKKILINRKIKLCTFNFFLSFKTWIHAYLILYYDGLINYLFIISSHLYIIIYEDLIRYNFKLNIVACCYHKRQLKIDWLNFVGWLNFVCAKLSKSITKLFDIKRRWIP